jgi:hypothetical protein
LSPLFELIHRILVSFGELFNASKVMAQILPQLQRIFCILQQRLSLPFSQCHGNLQVLLHCVVIWFSDSSLLGGAREFLINQHLVQLLGWYLLVCIFVLTLVATVLRISLLLIGLLCFLGWFGARSSPH